MAYHFSLMILSLRMLERNLAMNKIKMPSSLARKTTHRGQRQGDAEKEGRASRESARIRHFLGAGKSIETPAESTKKVTAETRGCS